jgi:hypothetical protein
MTTLPQEAVKAEVQLDPNAVIAAVRECARITAPEVTDAEFEAIRADNDPLYANTTRDMERAIRAYLSALPFLSVQVAVKRPVKALPSQDELRTLLRYEPETGKLFWRERQAHQMKGIDPTRREWAARQFNSRYAGKEAFTSSDKLGYRHGKINWLNYQAHRVIWKLVHGEDPQVIDHINRDPSDNRIVNLRNCTIAENSRNYSKTNKASGYRGVCWVKRDKAWAARISNGRGGKVSLGNFKNEVDAARAYDAAARSLHGEFATLNFPDEVQI